MYINFTQLIETTYYSVMEALKEISKEKSMELKKVSVEIPFTLDIYQKISEPMGRIERLSDSCSRGLKKENVKLSCQLVLNLKRREF
ncbi:MAG: hypothetical protein ACOYI2_00575 [Bacillota bacterium]|jgi:predicted P-loop ATPase/GTPase